MEKNYLNRVVWMVLAVVLAVLLAKGCGQKEEAAAASEAAPAENTQPEEQTEDDWTEPAETEAPEDEIAWYEFETEIPLEDAREMMKLCMPGRVDKDRYLIKNGKIMNIWFQTIFIQRRQHAIFRIHYNNRHSYA